VNPKIEFRVYYLKSTGPEGLGRKNFKNWTRMNYDGPNQITVKLFCILVICIDCYWCGFGGMGDRFDSITPPLTSFLVSPVIEEIKRRRESDFSLSLLLIHFCRSFYEMNSRKKQPVNPVIDSFMDACTKRERGCNYTWDTCTFL
jgi:hypothetical protein